SIGISPRTLQRWLEKEGTTFEKQLVTVQKFLALNLLQDVNIDTAEVSFLVGFSNVTTFYKAFKKWTGKTVLTYRHQVIIKKNKDNQEM
ncbi:AraC family transcriptional regulator, partial [Lactobacillus sp. XV13L]|nr:AraC family transcriptional regulator [Lactobacillus sp. XV13L]